MEPRRYRFVSFVSFLFSVFPAIYVYGRYHHRNISQSHPLRTALMVSREIIFAPIASLNRNIELLTGNQFFQLLANAFPEGISVIKVDQGRQGVHGFTIQQYIQFHEVGSTIANLEIVERSIAFRDTLQTLS